MTRPSRVLCSAAVAVVAIGVSIPAGLILMERAELSRRATDEPWRQADDWKGTYLSGVPVPGAIETAFLKDPPAPGVRRKLCEQFHARKPRCIGWYANVESVTPDGDGWNVSLTVSPRIESGTWFTTAKTIETWHVSAKGQARCDQCESGGPFFVFRD